MICKVPAAGGNVFFAPWRSCGDIFHGKRGKHGKLFFLSVLSAQPSFPIGKTDFSEKIFRQGPFPLATKSVRSRCVKSSRQDAETQNFSWHSHRSPQEILRRNPRTLPAFPQNFVVARKIAPLSRLKRPNSAFLLISVFFL